MGFFGQEVLFFFPSHWALAQLAPPLEVLGGGLVSEVLSSRLIGCACNLPIKSSTLWFFKCRLYGFDLLPFPTFFKFLFFILQWQAFSFPRWTTWSYRGWNFLLFHDHTCPPFETFLHFFSHTDLQSLEACYASMTVFPLPLCEYIVTLHGHCAFHGWPLHELSSSLFLFCMMETCWAYWLAQWFFPWSAASVANQR